MPRSIFPYFILLFLISLPCVGAQDALQSPESIAEQVKQFLHGEQTSTTGSVQIDVDALDPRLRLSLCSRSLETFLPPAGKTSGRVTVGVRCRGRIPWTLYVPAWVRLFDQVVVARRSFPRGTVLQAQDLSLERRDLTRERRGYFVRLQEVIGRRTARSIGRGTVLNPNLLERALILKRGARVSIVAEVGGVVARMQGRALEQGSQGERIRVLSLSSGKELEARVVSAGIVKVDN